MRAIESLLRTESFDLVVYLYLDLVLIYFALPLFRPALRAHFQARSAGLVFRDNGLRRPVVKSNKSRLRSTLDRWLLGRALRSGGLSKVAFLDHWCADRARQLFGSEICGYGVDPVFFRPCDSAAARKQFGLKPNDFVFLFFGVMSDRKGVPESLALLRQADLPRDRTAVIVAGPTPPEERARLDPEVAATAQQYKVIRHDAYIEDADLPPFFAAADCVVCVYKDFTGSSSVLLHAGMFGKLALVSPGGVMEDAVRRHQFGEVAGLDNPGGFIEAVRRLAALDNSTRTAMAQRALEYGRSMDARRFMSQFL
jgi:glycosyltransferase involved in cell wall biosynthesis